jgi:hypothetical protein
MVPVGRDEDLCLVAKPAKRHGMDDAIAVALENVARSAGTGIDLLMSPAAR